MRESIKMSFFQRIFGKKKAMHLPTKEKTVNVLVLGKAAVGKTSLIRKLVGHESFLEEHEPTLYDDFIKEVNVDEYKVNFKFMELGGMHSFPSMMEIFIQQAEMYILVYSADDIDSYNTLMELREKIVTIRKQRYTDIPIIVVRNKVDLQRRRSKYDRVRKRSVATWCYLNHDVSAKNGLRVNSIMDNLIDGSKFIGNAQNEHVTHVSGRYIYNEKNGGQSELYHKSPGIFSNADNSNEKMEQRRIRSDNKEKMNDLNRRNVSVSMPSLKRSISLTSLRQSLRRLRRNRNKSLSHHDANPFDDSSVISESRDSRLDQSTKSLYIRSSTLPEKQLNKRSETVRANTLPHNITGGSSLNMSLDNTDVANVIMTQKKSLPSKMNLLDPSVISRRGLSVSPSVRQRNCNSLLVSNENSPSNSKKLVFGSSVEIQSNRMFDIGTSDQFEKYTGTSINKSVSFRAKERPKIKLSRKLSTDDYCDGNPGSTQGTQGSTKASLEKGVSQNRNTNHSESAKGSPDIKNAGSTNNIAPNVNHNVRVTNSPQVLRRSIPVCRRISSSQNDLTDRFTVNIPIPETKSRGSKLMRSIKRKSYPSNSNSPKNETLNKNTEQKGFTGSIRDMFTLKDYQQKSQQRHSGSSGSDRSSFDDQQQKIRDLTEKRITEGKVLQNTRLTMLSSASTESFTSAVNVPSQSSKPIKIALSRTRSRSTTEVPSSVARNKTYSVVSEDSSNSLYGDPSRLSWSGPRASLISTSKSQIKGILKNGSIDSTSPLMKAPLRKRDSLSHNDISLLPTSSPQEKLHRYRHDSNRSSVQSSHSEPQTAVFLKSRAKPPNVTEQQSPMIQARRWLHSASFRKSIDECH